MENMDITNIKLFKTFQPFFTLMKLFGLYHTKKHPAGLPSSKKAEKWIWTRMTFSQCYSILMTTLMILNTMRILTSFEEGDTFGFILFMKITNTLWHILLTTNYVIAYRTCSTIPGFFKEWQKLQQNFKTGEKSGTNFKAPVWITVGVSVFAVVANTTFVGYAYFQSHVLDVKTTPFHRFNLTSLEDRLIKATAFTLDFYGTVAWMVPMGFYFLVGQAIREEFHHVYKDLKVRIEKWNRNCDNWSAELEQCRQNHQAVCRLVDQSERFLSLHTAVSMVIHLATLCLMLYVHIWERDAWRDDVILITMTSYWLLLFVFSLMFELIVGARINSMAHAPFTLLHNLDLCTKDSSSDTNCRQIHTHLSLFLHRLTGEPIGFSALQMFVIDRPTILTLIGMFVTYFVLLIQFQPSEDSTAHACDVIMAGILQNITKMARNNFSCECD